MAQLHNGLRPDLYTPAPKLEAEDYAAVLADQEKPVFVAESADGSIVGHCYCVIYRQERHHTKEARSWLYIDDLCVREDCRGVGIGRKLIDYAKCFACGEGLAHLELKVTESNAASVAFYEAMGFCTQQRIMEMDL
jgi:ribosomal protein S18 acetylase RimI-like enzyme